ncbi:MAG: DEAD/DEAH box helicase [Flammeovirgaceae bacterium]|nr:DEAD/DEAH box helicase [Flammeovirgaceae bacterium]
MKFSRYNIDPIIKDNIEAQGFKKPTDIQFKSIPHILNGEDVLAIAQTGTGKTAAFAIPILHLVIANRKRTKGTKALILAPTHELALQTTKAFLTFAQGTAVRVVCVYGGVSQDEQIAQLQAGADVIIATPGRMFDLISQGAINLNELEILVLDEADHMLDLGFIKDINDLIKKLPSKRQTLFFSATIDREIKKLAYSMVNRPIRIQISPSNTVAKNVSHGVAFIEMDHKRFFLESFIKKYPAAKLLIFVRTKVRAERVKNALDRVEIESATLHGDMEQNEREDISNQFREGTLKILITTDLSARGVDIPNVDFVVNYDLPESSEIYVHRVGRTGRAAHKGTAISFCSPEERELLDYIQENLATKIETLSIDNDTYLETLNLELEAKNDWKSLIKANEVALAQKRKGKFKNQRKNK